MHRILPLAEGDVDAAARIDALAFPSGEHGSAEVRATQLREELARPWARLRAAWLGEEVVGYALFWHVADEVHLLNVAVAPAHRRRGLGRALLEELVRYAREHAAAKIFLEVRVSNTPAIQLYEAFGFERLDVRKRYYADGEDALDMMRIVG